MKMTNKKVILALGTFVVLGLLFAINIPEKNQSNARSTSLDCRRFCKDFMFCAKKLNPVAAETIDSSKLMFYRNACYIGCKKQVGILFKCAKSLDVNNCSKSVACFQGIVNSVKTKG